MVPILAHMYSLESSHLSGSEKPEGVEADSVIGKNELIILCAVLAENVNGH